MSIIPEVFLGRFLDGSSWRGFENRRLPAYELPAPLRQADPNLRYQPVFELVAPDKLSMVRVGPNMVSYHRLPPYVGWPTFRPELHGAIDALFSTAGGLLVRRLGLRYLNALTVTRHKIDSVAGLDLEMKVSGASLTGDINLNYTTELSGQTQCTVRVATPGFVQGVLPADTSVLVDVDVFTKDGFEATTDAAVKDWVESAHESEKQEFFHLLTRDTIKELQE